MQNLNSCLTPINVELGQLLLDANNPRFAELGEAIRPIPEHRFAEETVKQATFQRMKSTTFDVAELRDTIKSLGFLPMDRIVVRKWNGDAGDGVPRFVVVEGNRRVTAILWLLQLHDEGKETLSDELIQQVTKFEALLLDAEVAPEVAQLILPGLRHVSGIKEWGPYQKAKAVFALRETGLSPQEVAQSFGLSTRAANTAYRCYMGLEQMKADEEFGEYAEPRMYSYFEETFKRRNVRDWLGWDDNTARFTNSAHLEEFYSWITPGPDGTDAKLNKALDVRDLSTILEDDAALGVFRGKEGSLARALAKYDVDHPLDWHPQVTTALGAVKSLTPDTLRSLDTQSIELLETLRSAVEQALADREKLTSPD